MDVQAILGKLGRSGQIAVGGALLVFIFSFLPWYTVSISFLGEKASGHASAWDSGIGAWFPVLLILAVGVVTVLAAMDTVKWPPLMLWTINTGAAVLAAIIIILRWVTFPSADDSGLSGTGSSAGAGYALYVSLVLAVVIAVFGYLAFAAQGGNVANLGAAFNKGGDTTPPAPPAPPQY